MKKFNKNEQELDQVIFCLQTYFSFVIALLTLKIISLRVNTRFRKEIQTLFGCEGENLIETIKIVLSNSILEEIDLKSIFKNDYFLWFIDAESSSFEEPIHFILRAINRISSMFSSIPDYGFKDIFKELYENLIPRVVRHDLGEYYTPNWIAEYITSNLELNGNTRILDPSCGSGTFLIHAINQIKKQCNSNVEKSELLNIICNHVIGFDINPIAILTARVNYLIAIVDLIPFARENFSIPIFLKDSIRLDSSVSETDKFDYIVGNPPWIGWENLSSSFREATQHLWKKYNLFSITKAAEARLGGGKKDFSMLFVYRSIDSFLKEKGELIFLINQSVFQSVKTGEGFRNFQLNENEPFSVLKVDDLTDLKPFQAAAQTSILYCRKGEETKYPVNYTSWKKKEKSNFADNSLTYEYVEKAVKKHVYYAQQSSHKAGSPWIIYPQEDEEFPELIKKLSGNSPYIGKAGVCTWLNGVFWIKVLEKCPDGRILIENLGEIGKKEVPTIEAKIEPDLVFPLIRGRDVKLWNVNLKDNFYLLVTNDPVTRKGISTSRMRKDYPETLKYLNHFKEFLKERSGYKKYFSAADPIYSIYNVDKRLFAPFRILWSEIGSFGCSIAQKSIDPLLGKKVQVPNNKVMYIPFTTAEEAYFVLGVVNSSIIRKFITAKKLNTSTSTNTISEMRLPKFNNKFQDHLQIAKLAYNLTVNENDRMYLNQLDSRVSELYN